MGVKRGWFGESYRHSLAAKGVGASGLYFSKKKVDLKRYAGTWEQESVKNEPWFQRGLKDVTATYELREDGRVSVVNRGVDRKTGKVRVARGVARSVSDDNRRLKVSFGPFGAFGGEYVIKSVDPGYKRAVVKSGETEWVLRRGVVR